MTETRKPKTLKRRFGAWSFGIVGFLLLGILVFLAALYSHGVTAPRWVVSQVENRINAELPEGEFAISGARLELRDGMAPDVVLQRVSLRNEHGEVLAQASEIQAVFSASDIVSGRLRATDVRVSGVKIKATQDRQGRLDLDLGVQGQQTVDPTKTPPEENPQTRPNAQAQGLTPDQALLRFKSVFDTPAFAQLQRVDVRDLDITFQDMRVAKSWQVQGGRLSLRLNADRLDLSVLFALQQDNGSLGDVALSMVAPRHGVAADLSMKVDNIAAAEVALQSPALAWLGVLDAPISGALRTEMRDDGSLGDMNGILEIGQGALQPAPETRPIGFDMGKAYFTYDPKAEKIVFSEVSVTSEAGQINAQGFSYLQDWTDGAPNSMVAQLQFSHVSADPSDALETAAVFDGGAVDMRVSLAPFKLELGQMSLTSEGRSFFASGAVSATSQGWAVALDARLNTIEHDQLLALWPVKSVPKTREWLLKNVSAGEIFNVNAAFRSSPGEAPKTALGYEFRDATVRYLKALPPIENGHGYASINGKSMSVVLEKGTVTPPEAAALDVAGTVISMPDVTLKPTPMHVALRVAGGIPDTLVLLDMPPFEFISKSGQPTDIATGRAELTADLAFDLAPVITLPDVTYAVRGRLLDVHSAQIVPGKTLRASNLEVTVDPAGMQISGAGTVADVPFSATWSQVFGPEHRGKSHVEGQIELSQKFVTGFDLGLPKGSVSGAGPARIEIDLTRDAPAQFTLVSDLNRVGLRIPALGWSLAKNQTGSLRVAGQLGTPPTIDSLALSGAGLKTQGTVALRPDGQLARAHFDRVQLGGWLDAPVTLVGRGANVSPEVSVLGGKIDIRRTSFGKGGSSAGKGGPITLALDRLTVSEGIVLTGFRGRFQGGSGFNGTFSGRVNGQAPISGTLAPNANGTAVRIRGNDAGAILRAAGVFKNASGGEMDLILAPRAQDGVYDGRLVTSDIRVKDAPALANLLGAISVVGLLDQLGTQGILFNTVDADFVMTPKVVAVTKGAAVGASLGVSMQGNYGLGSGGLEMTGVISPIYAVNGIGALFTRKGEGLFGFNYTLSGTADAPKVSVNPFSLLTPGMFREIFRAPPPKVTE